MINISKHESWLCEQTRLNSAFPAISTDQGSISYTEFLGKCNSCALFLTQKGIKEKDIVALLFSHSYDFWIAVNSLWMIGAVPVPLNSRNAGAELKSQIYFCNIKFLITDKADTPFENVALIPFEELLDKDYAVDGKWKMENVKCDSPSCQATNKFSTLHSSFSIHNSALIMFTSGSTGNQKAVVHTFASLMAHTEAFDKKFNLSTMDFWLASLPFYHIGGFMILVRSMIAGSSVFFPKSLAYDDVKEAFFNANPTHTSIVSTTLQRLLEENIQPPSNLKYLFLGGGYLSTQLCKEAIEHGWPAVKVYGSTETCTMITALLHNEFKIKSASVGKALDTDNIKIKINAVSVDVIGSGNDKSVGEILVSSNSLFNKYFNNEQLTAARLVNGFYHTGDYGWLDDNGYLYIEMRREDIIVSGGENVSAYDVEEILKAVNEIDDAFVFGLEDEKWGQKVCAAVVTSLSEDEIKNILKNKMAGFKVPKSFYYVKEIPRSELGKVKRLELMKLLSLNSD